MNTDSVIRAYLRESAVFKDSGVFLSRYVTLQVQTLLVQRMMKAGGGGKDFLPLPPIPYPFSNT
jgi:hypothetical protein